MTTLKPLPFHGGHFNIKDGEKFGTALQLLAESLFDGGATLFSSDNLICWNRNLSFLRDEFYLAALNNPDNDQIEKAIVWRTYILLYFAELASKREGDFVELGCYTGYTASEVVRRVPFAATGKNYYLYDLFEWRGEDERTHLPAHDSPSMHQDVVARFSNSPFVRIIKGPVPDSFAQGVPDRIAFAHIDMNDPVPEAGALEMVLPKLSSGGVVIFDDYGWWVYSSQKVALDAIAKRHGLSILEMPTGQGLLIKP